MECIFPLPVPPKGTAVSCRWPSLLPVGDQTPDFHRQCNTERLHSKTQIKCTARGLPSVSNPGISQRPLSLVASHPCSLSLHQMSLLLIVPIPGWAPSWCSHWLHSLLGSPLCFLHQLPPSCSLQGSISHQEGRESAFPLLLSWSTAPEWFCRKSPDFLSQNRGF